MVLSLIFRSLIHFELTFVFGVGERPSVINYMCKSKLVPTPLVEETVLSPLSAFDTLVKSQLAKFCCGLAETNLTRSMRTPIRSLATLSELRVQHCRELWCRSQMRLGSHIAVA